ncbi:CBN-CSN-4 protein [Caenorhabditis brenneri]|uniref:COP9 signalosome complex subunit 4 n=1 Tax=Caenorhabditis brenneri TaxID=135651 RepID=G0N6N0_CAEBE|nr:CBN-CSN-4 protein [Caenorhabditis brenneri]
MTDMERSHEVAEIFALDTDHKAQYEALAKLCNKYLPENAIGRVNTNEIIKIIDTVIALETGSMVVSRQFVGLITERLDNENLETECIKIISEGILSIIKARTISYEDQVCILRLMLASIYEKEGRVKDAAQALIAINSDTSPKFNGPLATKEGAKALLCIRITKLLLDCGEIDEAEQYVNRTSLLMVEVAANPEIQIEHKALQARVCDAKRRFVEAGQRYYELSVTEQLPLSDRITALGKAIVCVLLAKPGPQRSRLLTIIFKDDRAPNCPSFEIIAKMFLTKVIHKDELEEFEQQLAPHQRADEQGESILKGVIQEHNITAISQLHINITFKTLGILLGVETDAAESMAGEMIASERLHGYIDQTNGVLHFEDANPMRVWDSQILSTLEQVNKVSDMIVARHPEFSSFLS